MLENQVPKAITLEMIQAMSPEQRKTLRDNATRIDTPASSAVLGLLAQDGMMDAMKVDRAPAKRKTATRKKAAEVAEAALTAPGAKAAIFGRRA